MNGTVIAKGKPIQTVTATVPAGQVYRPAAGWWIESAWRLGPNSSPPGAMYYILVRAEPTRNG